MREGVKEGRKEETPNRQKGGNDESTCQLMSDTPPLLRLPLQIRGIPSAFFTSHQGVNVKESGTMFST